MATQTYMDADGLYHKYGTTNAIPNVAGEFKYPGPYHEIEIKLDLTKTLTTDGSLIVSDQILFPKNARVEEIEIVSTIAAVGATATLNLGLVKSDRTTAIDFKAFLSAFPVASMSTVGTKTLVTKGSAGAGTFLGTTNTTFPGYITADWDTAAFTAGTVLIRIKYNFLT